MDAIERCFLTAAAMSFAVFVAGVIWLELGPAAQFRSLRIYRQSSGRRP